MTTVDVPQAVALKGIPDVELVAVGTWMSASGKVTITNDDLQQALAARECPGIHNPVIKLGHDEPTPGEDRIRWDGTPAVGWVSNMRLSTNDAKLLGDYTGVPAWLADVMPSAYPQRSIEIQRDFRCQIGHTHPFVITAVSLLGVFPPAVGVIRSLNDVQALYTLAASDGRPAPEVTRSIEVGLAAAVNADTRRPLTDTEVQSGVDFDGDARQWEEAVARLLSAYAVVQRRQREQLTAQIAPLIDAGRYDDLAAMTVDPQEAGDVLYEAMLAAAAEAIAQQIAEATAQGLVGLTAVPDELYIRRAADGIAATMAATLSATAGRDAAQLAAPGVPGTDVAAGVSAKLSDLSDRFLRDQFSGAIGAARSAGRHTVLSVAPNGEYYAAEVNDANTCSNCRAADGTRYLSLDEAMAAYGSGGYHQCSGWQRCRGRIITVWQADLVPTLATFAVRHGDRLLFASAPTALKFNPGQKRDPDGKWGDGVPNVGAGGQAARQLLTGREAAVAPADLPDLMATLAEAKATNLTRLEVVGEANLFRKHGRDIPRSEMPQLPTKMAELGQFTGALGARGITGELEDADPRTLTATQNELDSAKVGQMYARVVAGTLNLDAVAFVSRDGHILDGHHRWAALASARAAGMETSMKVIRLDTDIDTLLEVADTVSGPRKTVGAAA